MVIQYLNASEFRNITNIQTEEYSDTQLDQLLMAATSEIDLRTGRTWQEVTIVTNEYYDGDGSDTLILNHTDLVEITELNIDKNYDGTFVSVDTDYVIVYEREGRIVLDNVRFTPEVSSFTKGNKTIKITYTYGNDFPDDFVKNLCAMIVLQQLRPDEKLESMIEKRISLLRINSTKLI